MGSTCFMSIDYDLAEWKVCKVAGFGLLFVYEIASGEEHEKLAWNSPDALGKRLSGLFSRVLHFLGILRNPFATKEWRSQVLEDNAQEGW